MCNFLRRFRLFEPTQHLRDPCPTDAQVTGESSFILELAGVEVCLVEWGLEIQQAHSDSNIRRTAIGITENRLDFLANSLPT